MPLRVGFHLGYWRTGPPRELAAQLVDLEWLGCDSLWSSEVYGADAFTPVAWAAALTSRCRLGTAVAQIPARSAATTATTAMTIDHLSRGRFCLGIGVSGPRVAEDWHGQPFTAPLRRTRDYVAAIRRVWSRNSLAPGPGPAAEAAADGRPAAYPVLKSILHPFRPVMPLYLAAEGPRNIALAAEIADGLLATHFSPAASGFYRSALATGFARRSPDMTTSTPETFEVIARTHVVVHDDIEAAADQLRPRLAREIGLMGPPTQNFHYKAIARLGFERECATVQELCLAGRRKEAAAAVTTAMVESVSLIGPAAKIKDDLQQWESTLATTIVLSGTIDGFRTVARILHG
jgi:F420-dependent oxidoreductase-like protein